MAFCWQQRGCDDEMQGRCPHNTPGESCPMECHFAACDRPTHKPVTDINLMLNPDIDREAAVKEVCRMCEHFLTHGPVFDADQAAKRQGNPNRFLL